MKKTKRKDVQKEKTSEDEKTVDPKNRDKAEEIVKPKYGPLLTFPHQRVWSRCVLTVAVMIIIWYNSKDSKETVFAPQKDIISGQSLTVECSKDYSSELNRFHNCLPEKCGRIVTDKLVSNTETQVLLKIAENGFKLGGSDGGASILDLHSGALSKGTKFINIYNTENAKKIFTSTDFAIYKIVKIKIQHAIAHYFGVDTSKIHLTKPTFFSKLTSVAPKTIHDEYWHPHVDQETYHSFHYTSLLYLNDYGWDFQGGRFFFVDKNGNSTIEPRKGRVSMFTSGKENTHFVEKVSSGIRYALTVSFTCDKAFAVEDPKSSETF